MNKTKKITKRASSTRKKEIALEKITPDNRREEPKKKRAKKANQWDHFLYDEKGKKRHIHKAVPEPNSFSLRLGFLMGCYE